eukprot:scaffold75773_cov57-Attheya_sp.AAC.3
MPSTYITTPPGSHLEVARQIADATTNDKNHDARSLYCHVEKARGTVCMGAKRKKLPNSFHNVCSQPITYIRLVSRAHEKTEAVKRLLIEGVVGPRVTSVT